MKRNIYIVLLFLMIFPLITGCKNEENNTMAQLDSNASAEVAVIRIKDYGDISFKLYKDIEPDVINKFKELCEKGFYNNKSIYTIIEDYVLLAGSQEKQENTQSFSSGDFSKLLPFYGALCASLLEDNECNLSNFYIINNSKDNISELEALIKHKGYTLSDYIRFGYKVELSETELDLYRENGGAPWLYGHTIVFGQLCEGKELLAEIVEKHALNPETEFVIDTIILN